MPLLSISGLTIGTAGQQLVKGVSFDIQRGEIFSVVGESGSGKSLTCLSILGLLAPNLKVSGSIQYYAQDGGTTQLLGIDQETRSAYALKRIAYIFQEPLSALNPVHTCGKQLLENIALCGVEGREAQKTLASKLLHDVELHDTEKIMKAYPFQLSGGQRQRVMIAMALAGEPELIIADEPTTALDVLIQDEILGLIRDLCRKQGKSVLFVSHDIDAVYRFSDRIAVMYKGDIVETDTAEQIIRTPQHPYTQALLACKPKPEKKGTYLTTLADTMEKRDVPVFKEPMPGEREVARIQQLGKTYTGDHKTFVALGEVSFSIHEGESIGLIGESGSGKSTISKLMVQLERPSGGNIMYDFRNKKPLSSNVQMIFQDPFAALNPAVRTGSMLKEVLRHHQPGIPAEQLDIHVDELLLKVGLSAADKAKYPSGFSGGQRQRLCIARALAAKPALLICDESTSALDLSVQAQILNLLKHLQITENLSILMITHSMAVAAWFCNYLIVLKNGHIVEQGQASELVSHPKDDYTKAMIAHI
jgi:peptide/nickel transport system ATP-binding protein